MIRVSAIAALTFLHAASLAPGCVNSEFEALEQSVEAACDADVIGVGTLDVENDYLPAVVNCENGAADLEALKAQAVAARSYLYYRLELSGDIEDGQSDQVYSCGREPEPQHVLAVRETSGEVLRYRDTQVAAFYVAGAVQSTPDCVGGIEDPTDTEQWVTYNDGLAADQIEQTMLGFVDPENFANRGCMSQNGSDCLAERGDNYHDMLRFYYGSDIEIETATGPCVRASGDTDAGSGSGAPSDGCSCGSGGGGSPLLVLLALSLFVLGFGRARRTRYCS